MMNENSGSQTLVNIVPHGNLVLSKAGLFIERNIFLRTVQYHFIAFLISSHINAFLNQCRAHTFPTVLFSGYHIFYVPNLATVMNEFLFQK